MYIKEAAKKLGELKAILEKNECTVLQQALLKQTDQMLRQLFEHCIQEIKNKQNAKALKKEALAKVKFPSQTKQTMPSLADAAIRHTHRKDAKA